MYLNIGLDIIEIFFQGPSFVFNHFSTLTVFGILRINILIADTRNNIAKFIN